MAGLRAATLRKLRSPPLPARKRASPPRSPPLQVSTDSTGLPNLFGAGPCLNNRPLQRAVRACPRCPEHPAWLRYARCCNLQPWRLGLKSGAFVVGLGLLAQLGSFEHHRHELIREFCHSWFHRMQWRQLSFIHRIHPSPPARSRTCCFSTPRQSQDAQRRAVPRRCALRILERQAVPGLPAPKISTSSRAGDRDDSHGVVSDASIRCREAEA